MSAMTITDYLTDQQRWDAVAGRDRAADGRFVYAVRTTGIYCRPWCPSRRPSRANVAYFEGCDAAEQAGFRPCKRCAPRSDTPDAERRAAILRACALIDTAETLPSLGQLADAAGLSPFHFHRLFRQEMGVTPRQYAQSHRAAKMRERLRDQPSVSDAIYSAGFESSGRFYAQSSELLGMTPSTYRRGGVGETVRYAVVPCSLGWVLVAATERGLCVIEFGDAPAELEARLRSRLPGADLRDADQDFAEWVTQVVALVETPGRGLDLPLDIRGTAFQQRVWTALRELPAGTTASYTAIAKRIGSPKAARAVAQACAANPLAVAIPCHRIVRGDGDLGGYRWGLGRKQALLERERS